mmetsp:Transcript_62379/g.148906  ORF Transcript_62379/g.148906 Transcript_62379/m.148906 type:complete len:107 (+) Transcript_62379:325-645(+)
MARSQFTLLRWMRTLQPRYALSGMTAVLVYTFPVYPGPQCRAVFRRRGQEPSSHNYFHSLEAGDQDIILAVIPAQECSCLRPPLASLLTMSILESWKYARTRRLKL